MSLQQTQASSEATAKALAESQELAALPQVVFRIMEMTATEAAGAGELEKAIVVDPAFSAKVLTMANSAHFALPRKVSSIKEAVMFIGLRQVRQMAMAIGVFDMFLGKTDKESIRRRTWWRHSVDTAMVAKGVAGMFNVDENEAYTCGLLHLIGKTILDRSNPTQYEKVMTLLDRGVPPWQAETVIFGCDHRDIALACAEKWGFPDSLVKGLSYYVKPGDHGGDAGRLCGVTAISSSVAALARAGRTREESEGYVWELWVNEMLGISPESAEKIISRGVSVIAEGAHLHI